MRTIRVTMQETVVYQFDFEVEEDFEADDSTVAEEAEAVFVHMEVLPPIASIDDRELISWEEMTDA